MWAGGMAFALGTSGGRDPRMRRVWMVVRGWWDAPLCRGYGRLYASGCLWARALEVTATLVLPRGLCLITFEASAAVRWEEMLPWAWDGAVCHVGLEHVSELRASRWW